MVLHVLSDRNICFYNSSRVLAEHRKYGNLAFLACQKPIPQLFTSSRLISFLLLFNRGEVTLKIVDRERLAPTELQNAPLTSVMSNALVPSNRLVNRTHLLVSQ